MVYKRPTNFTNFLLITISLFNVFAYELHRTHSHWLANDKHTKLYFTFWGSAAPLASMSMDGDASLKKQNEERKREI